jgi:hypothetical protein
VPGLGLPISIAAVAGVLAAPPLRQEPVLLLAQADNAVVFADDFDGRDIDPFGPGRWRLADVNGGLVYMAEAAGHRNVLCIRRDTPDGETYATYRLPGLSGRIQVQAEIRTTALQGGPNPKPGRVEVQLRPGGEGSDSPKDEFAGELDWLPPRRFVVSGLAPELPPLLRIGIQRGVGIVCVDNIVVTRLQ